MKSLMVGLMTWASVHTGLPMTDELPELLFVPACGLFYMQHADGGSCEEERYKALYSNGFIYLAEGWQPDNLIDLSTLLHELVHHLQRESGMPMTASEGQFCMGGNLEMPAYEAQFAWLSSAGVEDPMKEIGINPLAYIFITQCSNM